MTSLEFIEKEIEYCISLIEKIGSECETDSLDEDLYFRYLEQLEQKLNQLRQIKTELEEYQRLKDKETPKKPIKIKTDYMEAYCCPNCRHTFEDTCYCRFCGQRLDRSDGR